MVTQVSSFGQLGGARGSLGEASRPLAPQSSPAIRSLWFAGPGRSLALATSEGPGLRPGTPAGTPFAARTPLRRGKLSDETNNPFIQRR